MAYQSLLSLYLETGVTFIFIWHFFLFFENIHICFFVTVFSYTEASLIFLLLWILSFQRQIFFTICFHHYQLSFSFFIYLEPVSLRASFSYYFTYLSHFEPFLFLSSTQVSASPPVVSPGASSRIAPLSAAPAAASFGMFHSRRQLLFAGLASLAASAAAGSR